MKCWEALGNLFLSWYSNSQPGKHCPTTCCREECIAPNRLAKKTATQSYSTTDAMMPLKGSIQGKEGAGRRQLTLLFHSQAPVLKSTSLLIPAWIPSMNLGSWEVGMLQAFTDSSLISSDSLSLLRSRLCLSPARYWGRLKLINAHKARKKREEPEVWPHKGRQMRSTEYLMGSEGHKVSPAGTMPCRLPCSEVT